MAKISNTLSYPNQLPIESGDYLIGTAANSSPIEKQTKTFTLGDIANFIIDGAFDGVSYRLPVFTAPTAGEESLTLVNSLLYQDTASLGNKPQEVVGTTVYVDNGSGQGNFYVAGTTTTNGLLTVDGGIYFNSEVFDSSNTVGTGEQVLVSQADGTVQWQNYQGSGLEFQGAWDADINNPDLTAIPLIPANTGKYWIVSVAGGTNLPTQGGGSIFDWEVGDWAIISEDQNNNIFWDKIDNSSVLTGGGITDQLAIWTSPTELGSANILKGSGSNALIFNDMSGGSAATGDHANAFGESTSAEGDYSVSMGTGTLASGNYTFVAGSSGEAAGEFSATFGYQSNSDGTSSFAAGYQAQASGDYSVVFGSQTTADGEYSFAGGDGSNANGIAAIAYGGQTQADGNYSVSLGILNNADGNYSVALGYGNNPTAQSGVAIGYGNSVPATGTYSVAMGFESTASGATSTAIGSNTEASGESSTALGESTQASGDYSFAAGESTTASGQNSTALGANNVASGDLSTVLGSQSEATGLVSTAIGNNAEASGNYSVAIGQNTVASGTISLAMGNGSDATGTVAIAIGQTTEASGSASVALGDSTIASGAGSTAINKGTLASGDYSTAMGDGSTANNLTATAMGAGTTASGEISLAAGKSSTASGDVSVAIGDAVVASGTRAVALGSGAEASGSYSFSFGTLATNTASGQGSFSFGTGNESKAAESFTLGALNIVEGASSFAVGKGNQINLTATQAFSTGKANQSSGAESHAIGTQLNATDFRQIVIGSNNVPLPGSVNTWTNTHNLLTVGNGPDAANQSNALEITKGGLFKLPSYGSGTITGLPTRSLSVDAGGNVIETPAVSNTFIINGMVNNLASETSGYDFMEWTSNVPSLIPLFRNPVQLQLEKVTWVWMATNPLSIGVGESVDFSIGTVANNTSPVIGNYTSVSNIFSIDSSDNGTYAYGEATFAAGAIVIPKFSNIGVVGVETGAVTPNTGELAISFFFREV